MVEALRISCSYSSSQDSRWEKTDRNITAKSPSNVDGLTLIPLAVPPYRDENNARNIHDVARDPPEHHESHSVDSVNFVIVLEIFSFMCSVTSTTFYFVTSSIRVT